MPRAKTRTPKIAAKMRLVVLAVRRRWHRLVRWWHIHDRRYGWRWRAGNIAAAVLILCGAFIPIAQQWLTANRYELSAEALQLVGHTDPTLVSQLTYDAKSQSYQFNQAAVTSYDPAAALRSQVGSASGKGADKSLYALSVPTDFDHGVTYTDINSQLSFSLIPQFHALSGKMSQGHLVFPLSDNEGGAQAVYTLKGNGLKEDIVVPRATQDTMTFSYRLHVPGTLQVKAIPNGNGAIGVYGPDPALLGDISYGSSKDQQLVQKAREKAAKTTLVFGLPAPVIKDTHGRTVGTARFELHGTTLGVVADHLGSIAGAFTVDPSVVVTSASDFATGNDEGMINFNTSGQVTRDGLTGGSLAAGWGATSDLGSGRYSGSTVAYNGFMYYVGGVVGTTGGTSAQILFAPVNSNGTLGAWHFTCNSTDNGTTGCDSFTTSRYGATVTVYDGYMYILGGRGGSSYFNDVQYAPINADGTVGTWQFTSSFINPHYYMGSAVYNGYMYLLGGYDGSNRYNDVQYAPIEANGALGDWHYTYDSADNGTTFTGGFTTPRYGLTSEVYNGYVYVMGGSGSTSRLNDVQYASINADGTIGAWQSASSFTAARYMGGSAVYNGYLYILGGRGSTYYNDVQYAPIYANGSLGTWQTTSSFATARAYERATAYNGYLYTIGGYDGTTLYSDTQYAKIDRPGTNTPFSATGNTALPTARNYTASVAYNNYVYVLGGCTTSGRAGTLYNNVMYAPIDSDGTVGTWTTSSNTFVGGIGRCDMTAVVANGYLYMVGGHTSSGGYYSAEVQYAPINSNGSIGTWADTTSLGLARLGPEAWTYNGYLYVSGGYHGTSDTACNPTASNYCSDVWMAPISSTGTLGSWSSQGYLPMPSYGGQTAVNGNFAYFWGGDGSTTVPCSNIYVATMASGSGTLGSWSMIGNTSTTAFGTTCQTNGMTGVSGGYLYSWGNNANATRDRQDSWYAKLNGDGTFASDSGCGSTTCTGPGSLESGTIGLRSGFVYQGMMYTFGGYDSSTGAATNVVVTSQINNGGPGTAGTWSDSSNNFTTTRDSSGAAVYNGYLYVAGGRSTSGSDTYNDVQYTKINADGSLGAWSATSSFSTSRSDFGFVAYDGYLYVIAGKNITGGAETDISDAQYAKINSDGTLSSWASTTGLSAANYDFATQAYQGYLYVVGGFGSGPLNTVQYAPINSDGTIGAWQTTSSFNGARYSLAAKAYNGYLYIFGGYSTSPGYYNDVQYAAINGDGTLGAWTATTSFAIARSSLNVVAYGGYMYIIGGRYGSTYQVNNVDVAQINGNGSLSSWSAVSGLADAISSAASVVHEGYIYTLGGRALAGATNVTQYTNLNVIARAGHYSKLIDLGAATNVTGITYNGMLPGGEEAITYRAAGSNGVFGSIASAEAIWGTSGCLGTTTNTRYLLVTVTLDDSTGQGTSGSFADSYGTAANLTDFTVTYNPVHPPPQIRLRAGQTLQQGNLSALDTCYP